MLGQHRSTQRRVPRGPDDEERLTADIVELARRHGRLGYRKIAEMLRSTGSIGSGDFYWMSDVAKMLVRGRPSKLGRNSDRGGPKSRPELPFDELKF